MRKRKREREKKTTWKRKLYFCYRLKRVPSIMWMLMKSGNSLTSELFVFPHIWNGYSEENNLHRSRGAIFRLHSYFGFHYSEFFPQGPRSYLCTMLDGFSLLCSVPQPPESRQTPCTSTHHLNKPCMVPANSARHPCVWRLGSYFSLDLPLVSVICFSRFLVPVHWQNRLSPITSKTNKTKRCLNNTRKITFLRSIE